MRKSSSRGEISQFITSRSSINILSILPVRDTTSNAHSRPGLPVSVLASHPMRYATRERDFFPKRQFTVKLLGEAWRILRGVQQVVGCNKLLPTTSGSFHCLVVPPLLVRLSTRIFCASGCARSRIQRTFRDNLVEIWRRRPYKRSILHTQQIGGRQYPMQKSSVPYRHKRCLNTNAIRHFSICHIRFVSRYKTMQKFQLSH